MKTLILMRHAKSDWDGNASDHERPLSARGREAAPRMGKWLLANAQPEVVICSNATRTRETLARSGITAPTIFSEQLYLAEVETMIGIVQNLDSEISTAMLLGHNPGMGFMAEELLKEKEYSADYLRFPTAACAILDFPTTNWRDVEYCNGQLRAFQIPRGLE